MRQQERMWCGSLGGCLGLPECAGPGGVHGALAGQFADLQGLLRRPTQCEDQSADAGHLVRGVGGRVEFGAPMGILRGESTLMLLY